MKLTCFFISMTAAAVILPSFAPRPIISAWVVPSGKLHMATYLEGGALPVMFESCWLPSWAGPPFSALAGIELTTTPPLPTPCFGRGSNLTWKCRQECWEFYQTEQSFRKIEIYFIFVINNFQHWTQPGSWAYYYKNNFKHLRASEFSALCLDHGLTSLHL